MFYCDPINGDTKAGDGSKASPWGSFESVIKARYVNGIDSTKGRIHAGDTIKLMSGDHGKVSFQTPEYQNTETITVEADVQASPTISQLSVKFARNWTFSGITFQRPTESTGPGYMLFMNQHGC